MTERESLELAMRLNEEDKFDESMPIIYRWLKRKPNDPRWLTALTYVMLATDKCAIAYQIGKRCTQEAPTYATAWLNLGRAAADLWRDTEAVRYYKRALHCADKDEHRSMICVNLASVLVDNGRFAEGEEYAKQALEYKPDSVKGRANLGFCELARRKWIPGWRNYRYNVGSEWRPRTQFNDEPEWDGKSKGTIAVYGEQGLGDEISFASMLPDMRKWCDENDSELIVECDPRLGGLFQRSFPDIDIKPTRGAKKVTWDPTNIDYSIPAAQIGEYFRLHDSDFPGDPYLVPDPDRVLQWRALFDSKSKPVIGLAWRSGIPKTGSKYRQLDLERLRPILESVDAHWVSLQYKPAGDEIEAFQEKYPNIDIVEYPHGTLTQDYDDTVAMVAALDMAFCMHTTVNHVAGGLGIPAWVLIPQSGQWRYGTEGEDFPWAKSIRLIRQNTRGEWDDVIERTAKELADHFNSDNVQQRKPHAKKGRSRKVQKGKQRNAGNRKSKSTSTDIKPSGRKDVPVRKKDERPAPNGHDTEASGEDTSVQVQAG